ncbi:MAG: type II CRISPR-associated endonuclease Cas1 [Alphaproteobacteria bacterium]|nr:type II CRISPR-associated endonuclease Cas1 [Alphaproteobacteria bacterium]
MDRIIEIAQDNRYLAVDRGFMTVSEDGQEIGRVPIDQIGAVIANAHGLTYSNNLLVRLADQCAPLVVCGANHVPVSVVLPLESHHLQGDIITAQAALKPAALNRFWKEIIRAKLTQQAAVLTACGTVDTPLRYMAKQVKNGDPENLEGQGAKYYFQSLFGKDFRRDRGQSGINAMLNYGYTILRSAVIRSIVAAGLHPSLGIHHCNQYNAMRLADDLMEPFRPLVDFCVYRLPNKSDTVTTEIKQRLVAVLSCTAQTSKGSCEINYLIENLAVSLAKCALGETDKLDLPPTMTDMDLWGL